MYRATSRDEHSERHYRAACLDPYSAVPLVHIYFLWSGRQETQVCRAQCQGLRRVAESLSRPGPECANL